MANFNRVILVGNLTRDPELKFLPSGTACCEFSVAFNERYRPQGGEPVEKVHFFDVVSWKQTAENVAKYLKKGSACLVEGQLTQDRWQTPEGQNRSKVRISAQRVVFLDRKIQDGPGSPEAQGEDVPF
jgi:single-strand DNA-binding protein